VRGRVECAHGPAADGFLAALQPAPEPFVDFRCEYRSAASANPLDWLGGRGARLVLRGVVSQRPAAELIWQRGRVAAQALGGSGRSRTTLWERRRLDIVDAEFVVRGADTGAVERVFLDLQARFGTHLLLVSVRGDEPISVEAVLRTAGFPAEDVPALVATVRALGRAALRI
jgi:hypothetical protein